MILKTDGRIQVFDKEYFETKLPVGKKSGEPLFKSFVKKGEVCYSVKFSTHLAFENVRIIIRSSIDSNSNNLISGSSGNNSIRIYIASKRKDGSIDYSAKILRWITRYPGWDERILDQLSMYRKIALATGFCNTCGEFRSIRRRKDKKYYFAHCFGESCKDGYTDLGEIVDGL